MDFERIEKDVYDASKPEEEKMEERVLTKKEKI